MVKTPEPPILGRGGLVEQDVELVRVDAPEGGTRVIARVHCARRDCTMDVERCRGCAHFARIEPHEAGYVLLCSTREELHEDVGDDDENPR